MKNGKSFLRQQGVTLLEVLIAILVLSFGLLGMLGLTANGIKMTSSSHYRTIAAQQLASMAEMINTNPYIVSKYAPPTNTANTACLSTTGCAHTSTTTNLSDASYANMPNNDYNLWLVNLARLLPNGMGIVCLDASPADGNSTTLATSCSGAGRPTIKICWNENRRVSISGGGASGTDSSTDTCISAQL